MKVALFGGAFNPPHIGHLIVARQVLDFSDCDVLWFLPNYRQSPPKLTASVEHRLAMTRLIAFFKSQVSTIEIDNKLNGETINLLPFLPKNNAYTFIIGADQLRFFHKWGKYKELLKKMPFLVIPRFGYKLKPLYPNMKVLSHELLITNDISSTKIRQRVKLGLSIKEFVTKGVYFYIKKHHLYVEN